MGDTFEARRRKEGVAFLVVKFLRVAIAFQGIADDFRRLRTAGELSRSGLCDRLRELTESLVFDLKEKAHALFRNGARGGSAPSVAAGDMRQTLAGMKSTIERRTIDSYVGTGYDLLQILQEALYQVERYAPELRREKDEIRRLREVAGASAYSFTEEERAELARLETVDVISGELASDSVDLAEGIMERCESVMSRTIEVMRRFMSSAGDNEILILNLLSNRDLVEAVYGGGSAETILAELCGGPELKGGTGVQRALAYVRARCGNVTALASAS